MSGKEAAATWRGLARTLLYRTLSSDAALPLLRRRGAGKGISVLMYHEIAHESVEIDAWAVSRRDAFLRQLEYLRAHYDVLSLADALEAMRAPQSRQRPAAVLTFDDGCAGNLEHLLPIAEAESLPVTIFVATGHIRHQQPYWFDRITNAVQTSTPLDVDLQPFGLGRWRFNEFYGAANWDRIRELLDQLKRTDEDTRAAVANAIETVAGQLPRRGHGPFVPLDIAGVATLARSRWVTIGAHSDCHRLLPLIPLQEARESIALSRDLLMQWTQRDIRTFAFPSNDNNPAVVELVRELGFESACIGEERIWERGDSFFRIPRISVGRYDTLDTFRVQIAGGSPLRRSAAEPAAGG